MQEALIGDEFGEIVVAISQKNVVGVFRIKKNSSNANKL